MDVTNNVFKPILNLVVFKNNDESYSSKYYIEKRKIINQKLGAASPLDIETVKSLAMEFSKEMQPNIYLDDIVPPEVIYISQKPTREALIWKYTKKRAILLFSAETKVPSGEYSLPNLIFRVTKNGNIYVYSYKDEELTLKTKVFRAPFWNTSADGSVCMGNVRMDLAKPISVKELIKKVENRFFGSKFSHASYGEFVKQSMQSFVTDYLNCKNPFDDDVLVSCNKTIKSIINESA